MSSSSINSDAIVEILERLSAVEKECKELLRYISASGHTHRGPSGEVVPIDKEQLKRGLDKPQGPRVRLLKENEVQRPEAPKNQIRHENNVCCDAVNCRCRR